MIIAHIGLPKTATTFLQHSIFKQVAGLNFVHRTRSDQDREICMQFRKVARFDRTSDTEIESLAKRLINRRQTETRPLIVTDENISVHPSDFWSGMDTTPVSAAMALKSLSGALKKYDEKLKVLVGTRQQGQWLASRYAESSKHFRRFSQTDFNRRLQFLAQEREITGSYRWLIYGEMQKILVDALSKDAVVVLPLEALVDDGHAAMSQLADQLGVPQILTQYERVVESGSELRRNVLSTGQNAWSMRSTGAQLELEPQLQSDLLARFAQEEQGQNDFRSNPT